MTRLLLCQGTARHLPLRDQSVHCVVTSPPYFGLRDYGVEGQLGLEPSIDEYIAAMVQVFREVWRVLRPEGTLWLVIGDSYAGSWGNYHPHSPPGKHGQRLKDTARWNRPAYSAQDFLPPTATMKDVPPKNLCGIPWRLALALQADGWYLRSAITWCKKAPMPESVQDRPTSATEMVFLLTKQPTYFYDAEAVRVREGNGWHGSSFTSAHDVATKHRLGLQARQEAPGRNLWNYWVLGPEPTTNGHYASFPSELVRRCLLAGCPPGGIVFDPFVGSGTTLLVAHRLGRFGVGVDLSWPYLQGIARPRLEAATAQGDLFLHHAEVSV
jgi:DNA modification methylase